MAQFVAKDPDVEVNGQTVLAVVNGVSLVFKERILNILAQYNILDPKPDHWYKQQDWLNAFKEIAGSIGAYTLFSIGKAIPENADFPPEIDNLEKALQGIDIAYHMNHRGGDIGHYKVLSYDNKARKAYMECNNPYPCHFDRGIITAMVRRFKPADSISADVSLDESLPGRNDGAEASYYHITW